MDGVAPGPAAFAFYGVARHRSTANTAALGPPPTRKNLYADPAEVW